MCQKINARSSIKNYGFMLIKTGQLVDRILWHYATKINIVSDRMLLMAKMKIEQSNMLSEILSSWLRPV